MVTDPLIMSLKRLSLPLLLLLLSPAATVATDLRDPEIASRGLDFIESTQPATHATWRVVSSTLLTPTEPVPQGFFSEIRLLGTAGGYCAAWRDGRQGDAIVGARFDPGGRPIDPAGLPIIARSETVPVGIVEAASGCVVMYWDGWQLRGVLLPADEAAGPKPHFAIPAPGGLLWSGDNRMLFGGWVPAPPRGLVLYDGDGRKLRENPDTEWPVAAHPWGDGFAVVTRSSNASDANLSLWRAGADLQLEHLATWKGLPGVRALVHVRGEEILVVSSSHSAPPSVAEFRRFSPEGEQLDFFTTEIPWGSTLRDLRWDGAWTAEWRIHINRLVLRTDGRSIIDAYQVEMSERRVAERGSGALQVWRTHQGQTRYEMTAGEPVGEGRPLVEAPHPEVLIDGDENDSHFAALWYEPWHDGAPRRYFVGISPKDQPSLEGVPFADDPMDRVGGEITAGVAMGDGIALVAWVDRYGLWFRRLSNEGAWLDPAPVKLAAHGFFARSGVAKGLDGFVVTWGEWVAQDSSVLRLAAIDAAGAFRVWTLATGDAHSILEPAVLSTDSGYAVAWHHGSGCPPLGIECRPVYLTSMALYDRSFNWQKDLTPDVQLYAGTPPQLLLAGDSLMLQTGREMFFYGRAGDGTWAEEPYETIAWAEHLVQEGTGLLAHGAEILAVQGTEYGGRETGAVRLAVVRPGESDRAAFRKLLADWSINRHRGELEHVPQLFRRGSEVLLLSSEVTTDPAEGLVRRLRLHVLEKSPTRSRAVRRGSP
jgi:hypothetical protein